MKKNISLCVLASLRLCVYGLLLASWGAGAAAAQDAAPPVPSGAAELAAALARHTDELFDAAGRASLEEIQRRFGEADAREKKAGNAGEKTDAAAGRSAAAQRLFDLLAACPRALAVRIEGHRAFPPDRPAPLPGDAGAVLLRIDAGPGGARGAAAAYNLAARNDPIALDAPGGITWVVVELSGAPAGRSSLVIELRRPDGRSVKFPIDVAAPEPGRLKISILSSDTGRPAPAMVRMTWKTDGGDRRPENAVDLAPLFDGRGNLASRRPARIPGPLGGQAWWCVPGPFDMIVPAGEWEILIRRGVEQAPVADTFTVRPGETIEKRYTPRRWVDMRKRGWYSGDDHVHARLTCDEDARRLMAWAQAEDVHVTNVLLMGDAYRTWFQQRGFGRGFRATDGDFALVPGQECPRTHSQGFGHTLSLNTSALVRDVDAYWLYDRVADAVHVQGGLFGFAHVWMNHVSYQRGMSLSVPRHRVDIAEVMQCGDIGTDLYYEWLNLGYRMTATAGSDTPYQGTIGEVRMYAHAGEGPFSVDAWFEAVGKGRTFVTNGLMIELRVDEALPGDTIALKEPRALRVRARAWGDPEGASPVKLEVVRHGEAVRAAAPSTPGASELALDFELESGDGCWIAARAEGSDGSKAHTTPVYAVREPLRFWKFDAVEALIAKRLENLDDVGRVVADARKRVEEGKADDDLAVRQMARQGDAILERAAAARQVFEEIKKTAERERPLRQPPGGPPPAPR